MSSDFSIVSDNDDLPMGWVKTTVSDIGEIITGNTPSTKNEEYHQDGNIPFVKPSDLDKNGFLYDSEDKVTELGAKQGRLLPKSAVLVSCIGNLGKAAILGTEAICNQQINAIVPYQNISPQFVYHWTKTIKIWMEDNASATTVTILNKGRFSKAPFPLPPINEQKRIVEKVEALMARSRGAKEALDAIPKLIEQFRQSVLAAAFRGDLTADWREQNPNIEPASVLLERIRKERREKWEQAELEKMRAKGKESLTDEWKKKYKEPEAVDDSNLPEIPESWCWLSVDACTSILTDWTLDK